MTDQAARVNGTSRKRAVDYERAFLVPLFLFFLFISVTALFRGSTSAAGAHDWLRVVYNVLLAAFYVLAIALLLVRTEAKAKAKGPWPRVAAYVGAFLPMSLSFVPGGTLTPGPTLVALALMLAGMGFAFYALRALGRSFGVAPQVRTLVQHGPYRFIRHPLYAGELVAITGAVLVAFSWQKALVLAVVAALAVYRAVLEERLLTANIPEYADYMTRTKRFIPGVV